MISVVLPAYNRRNTVRKAVESVLNQTMQDIECIVVDDASTDDTAGVLTEISDSRLRIIRLTENSGACHARNVGVQAAKGEYIAFQDSDDCFHPDKLERQLALLKETGADVVFCGMNRICGQQMETFPAYVPDKCINRIDLLEANLASTQCIFGKAEAFRNTPFDEDMPRLQDWALMLELAKKYTDFSELTTPMINEFIEKIIVHAPEKIDGDRVQEVEIYLKFIGRFELPEPDLTPEEIKRQEQLRRHRIKSRERYQKIKAGEHAVGQPFQLICKCCGEEFESKRSNTLFCSPKCRTKFYRQEAAENRKRECVCENCGKTFTATRRDVKYCCDDCRTEANRRMQKERNVAKQIKKNEPVLLDAPPIKENGQKQKTA